MTRSEPHRDGHGAALGRQPTERGLVEDRIQVYETLLAAVGRRTEMSDVVAAQTVGDSA